MEATTCDCQACRAMCQHSVCLPTPAEARELVRQGYADRLGVYRFADGAGYVAPATVGHEGKTLPHTNFGRCTFSSEKGCELHGLGLKPWEGRHAHHSRPWQQIRLAAVMQWKGKQFESVAAQLKRAQHG